MCIIKYLVLNRVREHFKCFFFPSQLLLLFCSAQLPYPSLHLSRRPTRFHSSCPTQRTSSCPMRAPSPSRSSSSSDRRCSAAQRPSVSPASCPPIRCPTLPPRCEPPLPNPTRLSSTSSPGPCWTTSVSVRDEMRKEFFFFPGN